VCSSELPRAALIPHRHHEVLLETREEGTGVPDVRGDGAAGDIEFAPAIPLDLNGTDFQLAVWSALRAIPPATTTTYGKLAERVGRPAAARAVGAAVGQNPVSLYIPCHRVIGSSGRLTGYAGGIDIKRLLLDHESMCRAA
jgi:O-6-methylguanine DNA methyltransferase